MSTTATPTIPVAPTTATTAQVASHSDAVQTIIKTLESAPQNAANAEAYLNAQAESVTTWVSARHMKTRLLEVSAVVAVFFFLIGWFLRALIG